MEQKTFFFSSSSFSLGFDQVIFPLFTRLENKKLLLKYKIKTPISYSLLFPLTVLLKVFFLFSHLFILIETRHDFFGNRLWLTNIISVVCHCFHCLWWKYSMKTFFKADVWGILLRMGENCLKFVFLAIFLKDLFFMSRLNCWFISQHFFYVYRVY